MESFFSSLKTERLSRKVYRTREDARPTCSTTSRLLQPFEKTLKAKLPQPDTVRKLKGLTQSSGEPGEAQFLQPALSRQ